MRTDTLFYQVFQTFPQLVFAVPGRGVFEGYRFTSVEVKEKAFRFDGIFTPPPGVQNGPLYFLEVQFQPNSDFYWQLISEICLYLNQYKPQQDWVVVAIFPHRGVDVPELTPFHQELAISGRLVRVYLDEVEWWSAPELGLLRLITYPLVEALQVVSELRGQTSERAILDLVATILVYKFPQLSWEEMERMFSLDDLRQTRIFQDAKYEGELQLLMR